MTKSKIQNSKHVLTQAILDRRIRKGAPSLLVALDTIRAVCAKSKGLHVPYLAEIDCIARKAIALVESTPPPLP